MSLWTKIGCMKPCKEAQTWLDSFADGEEQQAWNECERGDWMLWLLGKLAGPPESESRKRLVKAALACANLAPAIENPEWEQARQILKTTGDYLEGTVTLGDVRKAANVAHVAYDAATYAAYAAATYAAYAATYAAYAAVAATYAADAATYAAYKRLDVLRQCANEVRKIYPEPPVVTTDWKN